MRWCSQLEGLPFCREDAGDGCVLEERDDARVRDEGDDARRVFDDGSNVNMLPDGGGSVTGDRKDAEH